jgi:hypothetical protein
MPVVKNIRDLFVGGHDRNPTLQDHAMDQVTEQDRYVLPPENPLMTARMPGDPDNHPLTEAQRANPFYGINPLRVSRLLQAGKINPGQARQARAWIDQYQKMTGETVHNGRNHDFVEPEVTGYNQCGVRRADPWPFK